jgi:hypothetical protein
VPKLTKLLPTYRRHKPSGRAVVTLNGKDHYLGPWKSAESKAAYESLIAQWIAAGRQAIETAPASKTVAEVCVAYLAFAKGYYRKDDRPTATVSSIKVAIRATRLAHGRTAAAGFGPLSLSTIRDRLVDSGNSRNYVNKIIATIRRMFKWAVARELVSPHVHHGLMALDGLHRDLAVRLNAADRAEAEGGWSHDAPRELAQRQNHPQASLAAVQDSS